MTVKRRRNGGRYQFRNSERFSIEYKQAECSHDTNDVDQLEAVTCVCDDGRQDQAASDVDELKRSNGQPIDNFPRYGRFSRWVFGRISKFSSSGSRLVFSPFKA